METRVKKLFYEFSTIVIVVLIAGTEVSHEVITVNATPGHGAETDEEVAYTDIKVIGKGTFGVVYRAKLCKTDQMVAIKKVYHNEKFKVIICEKCL